MSTITTKRLTIAPWSEADRPDDFLLFQSDLDPLTAAGILVRQAEDKTRPPRSVADILDRLAASAPQMADAMRAVLGLETAGPVSTFPHSAG